MNNTMMWGIAALVVIIGVFFLLNEYIYQEKQAEVPAVEGMSFVLSSFNGEVVEDEEGRYTLSFEEGEVFARICNHMGGEYTLDGNRISALVASTLMYCSEPGWLMTAEGALQQALSDGSVTLRDDGTLLLSSAEHSFIFAPAQ